MTEDGARAPPPANDPDAGEVARAPEPEPEVMPKWVPIAIGVVLVTLAALAVITGLRYRDDTLVGMVESRRMPRAAAAPPGEPEPGASRVMSQVPAAGVPSDEETHWARRGVMIGEAAEDAVVYINDVLVGHAREFDSENEVYDFAAPGTYIIRVAAPTGEERRFVVTVSHDAENEVAILNGARPALPSPSSTRR